MTGPAIGPDDFAPFREQFVDCVCPTCLEVVYALSAPLAGPGSPKHLAACVALLEELRAGTHKRKTHTERAEELRAEKAERLARLRAEGAPQTEIDAVERGYVRVAMSFMTDGAGVGIGGRIQ